MGIKPIVRVVAATQFFGVPEELADNGIREDQDQGSDGARLVECAGRTCYSSYGKGRSSTEYHQHIRETGHGSVTEHVSITFYIENVSRGLTHELVRHRIAGISQRSTRYVDESESPNVWHPLMDRYCTGATWEGIQELQALAREVYGCVVRNVQQGLRDDGIDGVTARKQARGAARGVLLNALGTALVFTTNIRSLRNILELRASPAADAEIRLLANELYKAAKDRCPEYFDDYEEYPSPDGIGFCLKTSYRKI